MVNFLVSIEYFIRTNINKIVIGFIVGFVFGMFVIAMTSKPTITDHFQSDDGKCYIQGKEVARTIYYKYLEDNGFEY